MSDATFLEYLVFFAAAVMMRIQGFKVVHHARTGGHLRVIGTRRGEVGLGVGFADAHVAGDEGPLGVAGEGRSQLRQLHHRAGGRRLAALEPHFRGLREAQQDRQLVAAALEPIHRVRAQAGFDA